MTELLQQLINGLSLGAIYALIALGYTMVYGVLRFINFAHSDVFMIGAFVGWAAVNKWDFPSGSIGGGLLVLLAAMAVCALLGMSIEKLAYKPLRGRSTLTVLITAIGVSLLIQNVAQNSRIGFGPNPRAYPGVFPAQRIQLGDLTLSSNQLVVIAVATVLLGFLYWVVHRTRIGTAMRALSFNATAASLVGINNNAVISFTFALGSAMAGAGGVLYAMNYPSIDPLMGTLPGLKAFVAAVLGGIGNLPGAALGGLLIGLIETIVSGGQMSLILVVVGSLLGITGVAGLWIMAFRKSIGWGLASVFVPFAVFVFAAKNLPSTLKPLRLSITGIALCVTGHFVAFSSTYRDAIAFGILILILLFRPAGLLGKLKVEKV